MNGTATHNDTWIAIDPLVLSSLLFLKEKRTGKNLRTSMHQQGIPASLHTKGRCSFAGGFDQASISNSHEQEEKG
jgi:hypothetical protein